MIDLMLIALWTVQVIVPPQWSFTPDVNGMSLEERRSYLASAVSFAGFFFTTRTVSSLDSCSFFFLHATAR